MNNPRHPLYDAHDEVNDGTHVVCRETADEAIELVRGRADAEEEWHLNEEDYEGGRTANLLVCGLIKSLVGSWIIHA